MVEQQPEKNGNVATHRPKMAATTSTPKQKKHANTSKYNFHVYKEKKRVNGTHLSITTLTKWTIIIIIVIIIITIKSIEIDCQTVVLFLSFCVLMVSSRR